MSVFFGGGGGVSGAVGAPSDEARPAMKPVVVREVRGLIICAVQNSGSPCRGLGDRSCKLAGDAA
jgi:hypothetical protein